MAVPRNRMSNARKKSRRANTKRTTRNIIPCRNCGALSLSHQMCTACGHYDGELIAAKKEKKEKEK